MSETVSELFSPGSPNKPLLDAIHTIFALLLTLFGIGLLRLVRGSDRARRIGVAGASLFIAMGLVSVATAAIFHQDPWGSPPTFSGQMHVRLTGVVGLLSILSMLLIGIWSRRAGFLPGLATHSFITIGAAIVATGFFVAAMDGPIMGLAERISALVGFQWTFSLAVRMSLRGE
jgi:hypothetical protein